MCVSFRYVCIVLVVPTFSSFIYQVMLAGGSDPGAKQSAIIFFPISTLVGSIYRRGSLLGISAIFHVIYSRFDVSYSWIHTGNNHLGPFYIRVEERRVRRHLALVISCQFTPNAPESYLCRTRTRDLKKKVIYSCSNSERKGNISFFLGKKIDLIGFLQKDLKIYNLKTN